MVHFKLDGSLIFISKSHVRGLGCKSKIKSKFETFPLDNPACE